MTYFQDQEKQSILHDWIHKNYGKHSGLHKDEYIVHFDPELTHNGSYADVVVQAGNQVLIGIRSDISKQNMERTKVLLNSIFKYDLRKFLRTYGLIKYSDAVKLYSLAFTNVEGELRKGRANKFMSKFTQEMHTMIKLTDKRTKKSVTVTIVDGDAFAAKDLAIKLLYGSES